MVFKTIPKWVMQRYSALYREFKCKTFNRLEVKFALDKCNKIYIDQKVPEELITRDSRKVEISTDKDFLVNEK